MLGASRHGLDLEMLMRKIIALTTVAAVLGTVSLAYAGSLGRPCTSAPEGQ